RRAPPQRRVTAGREQRRGGPEGTHVRNDARAATAGAPEAEHALALGDLDARVLEHALGEDARHLLARRGSAGIEDARAGMSSFEPRIVLEGHPEIDEVDDTSRSLAGQRLDGAGIAEAAPRDEGVG